MTCLVNSRFGGLWHVLKDVSSFHKSLRVFLPFHQAFWLVHGLSLTPKRFVYHFVFRNYVRAEGWEKAGHWQKYWYSYWSTWAMSQLQLENCITFQPRVASIEQIEEISSLLDMEGTITDGMQSLVSYFLYTLCHFILTVIPWEERRAWRCSFIQDCMGINW